MGLDGRWVAPYHVVMQNGDEEASRIREAIARDRAEQKRIIQEKLRAGRAQRASLDGQGSGPLPFGYVRVWDNGAPTGRIGIDEEAAAVVRRIFTLRDEGFGVDGIAAVVGREGFRTSSGKYLTPPGVAQILRHEELYRTGLRRWGEETAALRWPIILMNP